MIERLPIQHFLSMPCTDREKGTNLIHHLWIWK